MLSVFRAVMRCFDYYYYFIIIIFFFAVLRNSKPPLSPSIKNCKKEVKCKCREKNFWNLKIIINIEGNNNNNNNNYFTRVALYS